MINLKVYLHLEKEEAYTFIEGKSLASFLKRLGQNLAKKMAPCNVCYMTKKQIALRVRMDENFFTNTQDTEKIAMGQFERFDIMNVKIAKDAFLESSAPRQKKEEIVD